MYKYYVLRLDAQGCAGFTGDKFSLPNERKGYLIESDAWDRAKQLVIQNPTLKYIIVGSIGEVRLQQPPIECIRY